GSAAGTPSDTSGGFSLDAIDQISLKDAEVSLQEIPFAGAQPFVTLAAHKVNVQMENLLLDANAVKQWKANADLGGISVDVGALAAPAEFKSGNGKRQN